MHYLFCYDFGNDSLRTHVFNLLEQYGCVRLQYSVWFSPEWTTRKREAFRTALDNLFERYKDRREPTDSLMCIPIERDSLQKMIWVGTDDELQEALYKPVLVWI